MGGNRQVLAPAALKEVDLPILEHKSFVFVVYGYNQGDWCERSLRSIVSQDYDHFRIVFIDDGSSDDTWKRAQEFVSDNNQQHRVVFVKNEEHLGQMASLYQAVDTLLDKEIIIPLQVKDWLSHSGVLECMNQAYQNPDVWMTFSPSLLYPSYEIQGVDEQGSPAAFYAALFKQIQLQDVLCIKEGIDLTSLIELGGKHVQRLKDPSFFKNEAAASTFFSPAKQLSNVYQPLTQFPHFVPRQEKTDILIFSCDRPLQLYACLESIHRYISGFEKISVLYRASTDKFDAAYKKVKAVFPRTHFLAQSKEYKKDFKPLLMKAVFDSSAEYILFGVDDIVVKDFTDLNFCREMMEKTDAYGFYLRFGRHISHCYQSGTPQLIPPSVPLSSGIYAWNFDEGSYDWGFPNSLDMTLYRKKDLYSCFKNLKFKTPNSLEFSWANEHKPKGAVGLYFETSKIVNIPFNVVSRTGNPHMNYLSADELLVKFEEGFKMDIEPLYRVVNPSPHFEFFPLFIPR